MSEPLEDFYAAADAAGVPWHYDLSAEAQVRGPYLERLAQVYVARLVGLPDPGPGPYDPQRMERDLQALGDFSCRPLHDWAAARRDAAQRPSG